MSYILEALKKVEQKREQEERPRSPNFSDDSVRPRKKRIIWPYVLTAALLVNAALIVRWIWPEPPSEKSVSREPSATLQPATRPSEPAPVVERERREGKIVAPLRRTDKHEAGRDRGKTSIPPRMPETAVHETAVPLVKIPAVAEGPAEPVAPVERRRAPSGRIYTPGELPADVRSGLPEFRISGHAYSPEAQTRVVRINEKILQEGQDLSPGLKLEEIVPTGVILSYQGYRFRVAINQAR